MNWTENEFNIQSTNAYNCGSASAILAQLSKHLLTGTVIYKDESGIPSNLEDSVGRQNWKGWLLLRVEDFELKTKEFYFIL